MSDQDKEDKSQLSAADYATAGLGVGGLGAALAGKHVSDAGEHVANVARTYTGRPTPRDMSALSDYATQASRMASTPVFGFPAASLVEFVRNTPEVYKTLYPNSVSDFSQIARGKVTGHYGPFKNRGPIAGYDHLVRGKFIPPKGKLPFTDPVSGKPVRYKDWLSSKLDDFIYRQQKVVPSDVYLSSYPMAKQEDLLKEFQRSLTPAERAAKVKYEAALAKQGDPFNPREAVAEVYGQLGSLADTAGSALAGAGGAVAGGALGRTLYTALKADDKETTSGQLAAIAAGSGLGGIASFAATPNGRRQLQKMINKIKGHKMMNDAINLIRSRLAGKTSNDHQQASKASNETFEKLKKNYLDPAINYGINLPVVQDAKQTLVNRESNQLGRDVANEALDQAVPAVVGGLLGNTAARLTEGDDLSESERRRRQLGYSLAGAGLGAAYKNRKAIFDYANRHLSSS